MIDCHNYTSLKSVVEHHENKNVLTQIHTVSNVSVIRKRFRSLERCTSISAPLLRLLSASNNNPEEGSGDPALLPRPLCDPEKFKSISGESGSIHSEMLLLAELRPEKWLSMWLKRSVQAFSPSSRTSTMCLQNPHQKLMSQPRPTLQRSNLWSTTAGSAMSWSLDK